jgi:hypothetical protein
MVLHTKSGRAANALVLHTKADGHHIISERRVGGRVDLVGHGKGEGGPSACANSLSLHTLS